ncbi:RsmE family RNA methyltransferase [Treponema pectinovorum]|uniref:RsmE family RNA methyltransferase n=1 Tax=Treponema pectinovorum TaxID=164 RepID=UPI0011CA6942|nr:RsmE family RNA methyltransferase [Treponema pectinovorum]
MRQFISCVSPNSEGLVKISGKDYKYLAQVLRLTTGDMICLRIPDGSLLDATVSKIDEKDKHLILQVCNPSFPLKKGENQSEYESQTDFYLFQFMPKSSKMDFILRQAVECGVKKLIPVIGEFCESYTAEKKFKNDRYERIIKEARQQSGSPIATEILQPLTLEDACNVWNEISEGDKEKSFACVLYERSLKTKNLYEALVNFKAIRHCAIFCGAEGGISPKEIDFFLEKGIIPIHFETNILRCETAALYGTACLQSAITGKKLWKTTSL